MRHFYKKIKGWFDFQDIYRKVAAHAEDGDTVVEVGSWEGRSTAYMAVELLNSKKRVKFVAVDTWMGAGMLRRKARLVDVYERFEKNMAPVREVVSVLKEDSVRAARCFDNESLAFVFIDADHSYAAVKRDLEAWAPKVKKAGLFGGHDYINKKMGVRTAVDEYFGAGAFSVVGTSWLVLKSFVDGMWRPACL